mmetsp:Transcript_9949/g.24619  ORF Transcript_9949/g.24619 Transcript_9949/m.24619 type:complete len:251 (+) Transcript_9949:281-1033(+)
MACVKALRKALTTVRFIDPDSSNNTSRFWAPHSNFWASPALQASALHTDSRSVFSFGHFPCVPAAGVKTFLASAKTPPPHAREQVGVLAFAPPASASPPFGLHSASTTQSALDGPATHGFRSTTAGQAVPPHCACLNTSLVRDTDPSPHKAPHSLQPVHSPTSQSTPHFCWLHATSFSTGKVSHLIPYAVPLFAIDRWRSCFPPLLELVASPRPPPVTSSEHSFVQKVFSSQADISQSSVCGASWLRTSW